MATVELLAVGLCFVLLAGVSSWLLLDSWRERRRARFAADLAATYGTSAPAPAELDEETWPIVAQQPQREFPNAATIRIPRQVVDTAALPEPSRHAAWHQGDNPRTVTVPQLLAVAVEAGEPLRLAWPPIDPDSDSLVQWDNGDEWPTGVLPVIQDNDFVRGVLEA